MVISGPDVWIDPRWCHPGGAHAPMCHSAQCVFAKGGTDAALCWNTMDTGDMRREVVPADDIVSALSAHVSIWASSIANIEMFQKEWNDLVP